MSGDGSVNLYPEVFRLFGQQSVKRDRQLKTIFFHLRLAINHELLCLGKNEGTIRFNRNKSIYDRT